MHLVPSPGPGLPGNRGPGIGGDGAAGEQGEEPLQLVQLSVVEAVAGRDAQPERCSRLGTSCEAVERRHHGGHGMGSQRLLGPERGDKRLVTGPTPKLLEELETARRLHVGDLKIGQVPKMKEGDEIAAKTSRFTSQIVTRQPGLARAVDEPSIFPLRSRTASGARLQRAFERSQGAQVGSLHYRRSNEPLRPCRRGAGRITFSPSARYLSGPIVGAGSKGSPSGLPWSSDRARRANDGLTPRGLWPARSRYFDGQEGAHGLK